MKKITRELSFYTDGAFSYKTEIGGWASICVEDNEIIDSLNGYELYSTNNRMELTAFLTALRTIDTVPSSHISVTIYTDSAYIANCINDKWYSKWLVNGWRTADKQSVKNQDLWSEIIALYIKNSSRLASLTVEKVKGHSDDKYNNYADLLAVKSRTEAEELAKQKNVDLKVDD